MRYVAQAASFKAACVRLCGCRQCRMGCRGRAAALPGVGRHPARRCQQIVGTRIQLAATRERCFAGLARGDRRCMLVAARHVAVGVTSNGARNAVLSPRCIVSPAGGSFFTPLGRFPRRCVVFRAVALFPAPLCRFSRRYVDSRAVASIFATQHTTALRAPSILRREPVPPARAVTTVRVRLRSYLRRRADAFNKTRSYVDDPS